MKPTDTISHSDPTIRQGFVMLPRSILLRPDLSRDAKLMYAVLLHHSWQAGSCFPSYKVLREEMHCGINQVTRYLRELEVATLITRRRKFGQSSTYILNNPPEQPRDRIHRIGENVPVVDPVITDSVSHFHQNGESFSPKRGDINRSTQVEANGITTTAPLIPPTPREVKELGKWAEFNDTLEATKRGYKTDIKFLQTLRDRYPHLDPYFQAVSIAEWLSEHRQRKCSTRFIINWLTKAEDDRVARAAERSSTKATTGPVQPSMAVKTPPQNERPPRTWEEIEAARKTTFPRLRELARRAIDGRRDGVPTAIGDVLTPTQGRTT